VAANAQKLKEHGFARPGDYFDLALSGIAFVPGVGDIAKAAGRAAKGVIAKGVAKLRSVAGAIWDPIGSRLSAIGKGVAELPSTVKRGVTSAVDEITGTVHVLDSSLTSGAMDAVSAATSRMTAVTDRAKDLARGVDASATTKMTEAQSWLGKLTGSIPDLVKTVFGRIRESVQGAVNGAAKAMARADVIARRAATRLGGAVQKAERLAHEIVHAVRARVRQMRRRVHGWVVKKRAQIKAKLHRLRTRGTRKVMKLLREAPENVKAGAIGVVQHVIKGLKDLILHWLEEKRSETSRAGRA